MMQEVHNQLHDIVDRIEGKTFKLFKDDDVIESMKTLDALSCNCCSLCTVLIRKHQDKTFYIQFQINNSDNCTYTTREYLQEILIMNNVKKHQLIHDFDFKEPLTQTIQFKDGRQYVLQFTPVTIYETNKKRKDNMIIPFLNDELEKLLLNKSFFIVFKMQYVKVKLYCPEKLNELLNQFDEKKKKAVSKKKKNNKCKKSKQKDVKDDIITEGVHIEVDDESISDEEGIYVCKPPKLREVEVDNEEEKNDIPPKLQEVKAKQNKTYLVNEFQPSIVCDIVETDKIGVETKLNIVFDKNSTFENTGYINTLLHNAYNSKPQFKEYFSEYDVIYVVKDLHWDNSYSKRGLHFNLKLISEYKTSPMIHAYIHEGIINNMTYISFIF